MLPLDLRLGKVSQSFLAGWPVLIFPVFADAYSCDRLPMPRSCLDDGSLSFLEARFPKSDG